MNIYLICPVRNAAPEATELAADYVTALETQGHEVFFPMRNVDQHRWPVEKIIETEIEAIKTCDEVHIFWENSSRGSHFDLGAALALGKRIKLVHSFTTGQQGKSYESVIRLRSL